MIVAEQTPTILVPRKTVVEGKIFPEQDFKRTDKALKELEDAKNPEYEVQFMPEVADARIESPSDSSIWQTWVSAPSIRATGKTSQGTPVVVYAHVPNYLSTSENITKAIDQGLVNGAGRIPKDEFQRLLDLEGERVFVVDYETLKRSSSDVVSLTKAAKHPQTTPFLGGKDRIDPYLAQHGKAYNTNKIGVWHSDDLSDEPLARVLHVGGSYDDGLSADSHLNDSELFLGVSSAGEASVPKISPTQNGLTRIINEYIAPVNQKEVHERVSALFR